MSDAPATRTPIRARPGAEASAGPASADAPAAAATVRVGAHVVGHGRACSETGRRCRPPRCMALVPLRHLPSAMPRARAWWFPPAVAAQVLCGATEHVLAYSCGGDSPQGFAAASHDGMSPLAHLQLARPPADYFWTGPLHRRRGGC